MEAVGRAYPGAWPAAERFRALRQTGELPAWPDWCYLPLHAAYAVVSGGGDARVPYERAHHIAIVGAMQAWRIGQQIMRYDPALYEPMIQTPIGAELPTALLYRLPVWCPYIETPGLAWEGRALHGAWVHLDWDDARQYHELRLVLDAAESPELALDAHRGLVPVPLILGEGSIADAIARVVASGAAVAAEHGARIEQPTLVQQTVAVLEPLLSLTLYLCSDSPDWAGEPPRNPHPVRTRRHGWRLYPADGPRVWDVGVRLGAALRRAYQAEQTGRQAPHAGPRPHIRRAHWHTILHGPRLREGAPIPSAERRAELRWLPPIAVRMDDLDALPATIRPVS